jgi:hypothetical protein
MHILLEKKPAQSAFLRELVAIGVFPTVINPLNFYWKTKESILGVEDLSEHGMT